MRQAMAVWDGLVFTKLQSGIIQGFTNIVFHGEDGYIEQQDMMERSSK